MHVPRSGPLDTDGDPECRAYGKVFERSDRLRIRARDLGRKGINAARLACNQNHTGPRLDKVARRIRERGFFSRAVETGW